MARKAVGWHFRPVVVNRRSVASELPFAMQFTDDNAPQRRAAEAPHNRRGGRGIGFPLRVYGVVRIWHMALGPGI